MIATRRLDAILAADVVGYSRLVGANEEETHEPKGIAVSS
jgi:class 3 adenylate cyclase